MDQTWLSPDITDNFVDAVLIKEGALYCYWGFTDVTLRACWRPGEKQRVFQNGHKYVNEIKFKIVTFPNELIVNLFRPVEGRGRDAILLQARNERWGGGEVSPALFRKLEKGALIWGANALIVVIYG